MRKRLLLLSLWAAAATACDSPLSPSEWLRLTDAEARWAARPFPDYSFEMFESCFCPAEMTQWARVEVVNDQVSRVVLLATGADVPPPRRDYFPTVERIFSYIHSANHDDYLRDLVVAFDPHLGYPTQVDFLSKPDIMDGGATYYLRNAAAMPATPSPSTP
jgi:hypothetical protein